MPAIKPIKDIAEKWARVTPARAGDYREGVKHPRKDWEAETLKAADVYKAAVTKAAAEGRFAKGVAEAGTEKWQKRAITLGPSRFSEGVMAARPDYEKAFAPYADVIAGVELPPRAPRGDPANIERVRAITTALHAKKMG